MRNLKKGRMERNKEDKNTKLMNCSTKSWTGIRVLDAIEFKKEGGKGKIDELNNFIFALSCKNYFFLN